MSARPTWLPDSDTGQPEVPDPLEQKDGFCFLGVPPLEFSPNNCRLPYQPGGIFMEALRAADTSEQDTLCGQQPDSCPRTILWHTLFFPANLFELRAGPLALLAPFVPSEVVWAPASSQSLSSAMTCPAYMLKPPALVRVCSLGKGGLEKSAASVFTPHLLLTPPPL